MPRLFCTWPLYRELKRRANSGEFGHLNLAQVNFGSYKEYGDLTNRFYNPKLAGGAMLDIGVYAPEHRAPLYGRRTYRDGVAFTNRAVTGVGRDERVCYAQ